MRWYTVIGSKTYSATEYRPRNSRARWSRSASRQDAGCGRDPVSGPATRRAARAVRRLSLQGVDAVLQPWRVGFGPRGDASAGSGCMSTGPASRCMYGPRAGRAARNPDGQRRRRWIRRSRWWRTPSTSGKWPVRPLREQFVRGLRPAQQEQAERAQAGQAQRRADAMFVAFRARGKGLLRQPLDPVGAGRGAPRRVERHDRSRAVFWLAATCVALTVSG